ncbi:MAG TPA: helix-turn-helix transcriptional regulator [Candidatus Polarisedimenticolia bacterium]|nr:helix-turn-helix transcriptional regulator [Candidatus Polarisedimenticolia bacterium]
MRRRKDSAYYMISVVARQFEVHPQTLRLYEREGLLRPSRTEGNTRLYSDQDLEVLSFILSLTRDLGVNLAGVEIILNMRRKMEAMQMEMDRFMTLLREEVARRQGSAGSTTQALVRVGTKERAAAKVRKG